MHYVTVNNKKGLYLITYYFTQIRQKANSNHLNVIKKLLHILLGPVIIVLYLSKCNG
jgi:hypothetical protein